MPVGKRRFKEAPVAVRAKFYRHVVLFKFKDSASAETVAGVEAAFRAFCAGLPFVADLEWGRNSSPEGLNQGFTHCFIVSFAGPEGRDAYLPHPDHRAFCQRWLDPNLEKACVVDFAPID
jgi:hypothetical protein